MRKGILLVKFFGKLIGYQKLQAWKGSVLIYARLSEFIFGEESVSTCYFSVANDPAVKIIPN